MTLKLSVDWSWAGFCVSSLSKVFNPPFLTIPMSLHFPLPLPLCSRSPAPTYTYILGLLPPMHQLNLTVTLAVFD